jgi:hypothetical protein
MTAERGIISVQKGNSSVIIVHPRLVERFEYDIEVVDNGSIYQINDARKLVINIQESGNTLEFKEKKSSDPSLYIIPLRNIETTRVTEIETKQMIIGKRTSLLLEIEFIDNNQNDSNASAGSVSSDTNQDNKRSIKIDLEKKKLILLLEEQLHLQKIQNSVSNVLRINIHSSTSQIITCV